MPTVAVIDGIKIQLYWDDHPPAHFHAEFAEDRAQIEIESLSVIGGFIRPAQYRKVVAWARPRKGRCCTRGWLAKRICTPAGSDEEAAAYHVR